MRIAIFAASLPFLLAGCEERLGPERVPTVPITGKVLVNGQPASKLTVKLHARDERAGDGIYTASPSAMTADDGTFAISTYVSGDGAAAGTYSITFEWLTYKPFGNQYGPPDKLEGKYADPKQTPFEITVTGEEDEAIELEPFELET